MSIVTNFPTQCIHINYVSCKSITVLSKARSLILIKVKFMNYVGNFLCCWYSVFVFNRKLTFAKDDLTLNEFFISKNVSVNTIVEIKVGSSMNSLCSVELSCINDNLISDQCIPGTYVFYNSWKKTFFSPFVIK